MEVKFDDVVVGTRHPETLTQSYHAGVILSMFENAFPREEVSFVQCLMNFHSLREVFGERLWALMKSRSKFAPRIEAYERLSYQPGFPRSMIGGHREFCLGYSRSFEFSRLKKSSDKQRAAEAALILKMLTR